METKYQLPLLIYDDQCPLCVRFRESLKRLPGVREIDAASLHDSELYDLYPFLSPQDCHDQLHFLDQNGTVHRGEDAIAALIKEAPGVKKFSWLLDKGMGRKAIDLFYKAADKKRKKLIGSCPSCS